MISFLKGWEAIFIFTIKPSKNIRNKDVVKNAWKKNAEKLDFIDGVRIQGFLVFSIAFAFLS